MPRKNPVSRAYGRYVDTQDTPKRRRGAREALVALIATFGVILVGWLLMLWLFPLTEGWSTIYWVGGILITIMVALFVWSIYASGQEDEPRTWRGF